MPAPPSISTELPTRLLRERVRRVFRHLPKALAGDEEALHQLRVWGRRLRVALPVLARKPRGKRVRRSLKILRQITRTAGTSRDLDVMVAQLDRYMKAVGPQPAALRLLRRRLGDARSRSRRRMAEGMLDLEIARVRRDLRAIVARRGEALFTVLLRLRQARDTEGAQVAALLARLEGAYDPEALHRLRIEVRRLRYLAEALDSMRGQQSEGPAIFKQLQDRLGLLHDAYLLSVWAQGQARRADARGQADIAAQASVLHEHFLEESRRHHRQLLEEQPVDLLERGLAAMGRAREIPTRPASAY